MVLKSWNPLLDKIHRRLTESISECKSYNLDNIKGRAAVRTENWEGQRGGGTGKGWREGQVGSQEYFQWKKKEADYTAWFFRNTLAEGLKTVD